MRPPQTAARAARAGPTAVAAAPRRPAHAGRRPLARVTRTRVLMEPRVAQPEEQPAVPPATTSEEQAQQPEQPATPTTGAGGDPWSDPKWQGYKVGRRAAGARERVR